MPLALNVATCTLSYKDHFLAKLIMSFSWFSLLSMFIFLSAQYCAACPQRCTLHNLIQRTFFGKIDFILFFKLFIAFNVYLFIFSALYRLSSTCTLPLQLAQSHTKWHKCIFSKKIPFVLFNIPISSFFHLFSAVLIVQRSFCTLSQKGGWFQVSQNCLFFHTPLIYSIF